MIYLLTAQAHANSFNLHSALKYSLGPLSLSIARLMRAKLLQSMESLTSPCDVKQVSTWMKGGLASSNLLTVKPYRHDGTAYIFPGSETFTCKQSNTSGFCG